MSASETLLQVDDLHVEFRTRDSIVRAVNGVSYELRAGETLAILGESGSGKTISAMAVMGLLDVPPAVIAGGRIRYRGRDLLTMPERERRTIRGKHIGMIFQDALSALNPVLKVGFQIGERLRVTEGLSRKAAGARAVELMERVRIPAATTRVNDYPHQFSGGMRQRVMIAMALALGPEVLIADEPTTALDVTVQAQIMDLLAELQRELGMALLLITHDLGVVANVADRIAVMYAGRIVETADAIDLYERPAHPYTRGLLRSLPQAHQRRGLLTPIAGAPPSLAAIPPGCPYHPRCEWRAERCTTVEPAPEGVGDDLTHQVACHRWKEVVQETPPAPSRGDPEDEVIRG
ncbi:MAG: ABC transporter ATP-binding protein [Candidatus Dormiibacterota bacterium]